MTLLAWCYAIDDMYIALLIAGLLYVFYLCFHVSCKVCLSKRVISFDEILKNGELCIFLSLVNILCFHTKHLFFSLTTAERL